jgi:hypothetical protein
VVRSRYLRNAIRPNGSFSCEYLNLVRSISSSHTRQHPFSFTHTIRFSHFSHGFFARVRSETGDCLNSNSTTSSATPSVYNSDASSDSRSLSRTSQAVISGLIIFSGFFFFFFCSFHFFFPFLLCLSRRRETLKMKGKGVGKERDEA